MPRKLTREQFIEKANIAHNFKYDYSLVEYINNKTNIIIVCPSHGIFQQTPDKHINSKTKCPKCSGKYQPTTNDFIEKANRVHNNKYDYSLVQYINTHTKIKIICPTCGIFKQSPHIHLTGKYGCRVCGTIAGASKITHSTGQFIEKSNDVHNNKYDYSLVQYINTHTKVQIICSIHGKFLQMPYKHLQGAGCPTCSSISGAFAHTLSTSDFIEKANKVHNSKYDYSLVEYIGTHSKVKIICDIHGIFEQRPVSHISMRTGCPVCSSGQCSRMAIDWIESVIKKGEDQY